MFVWTSTCVAGLVLFLEATSIATLGADGAIRTLAIAIGAALVLRSLARFAWRRMTPPERILVVGGDGLARSIRRKLELFSDIHATVAGERAAIRPETLRNGWADAVDRVVVAAQSLDERLIAELVATCRRASA